MLLISPTYCSGGPDLLRGAVRLLVRGCWPGTAASTTTAPTSRQVKTAIVIAPAGGRQYSDYLCTYSNVNIIYVYIYYYQQQKII